MAELVQYEDSSEGEEDMAGEQGHGSPAQAAAVNGQEGSSSAGREAAEQHEQPGNARPDRECSEPNVDHAPSAHQEVVRQRQGSPARQRHHKCWGPESRQQPNPADGGDDDRGGDDKQPRAGDAQGGEDGSYQQAIQRFKRRRDDRRGHDDEHHHPPPPSSRHGPDRDGAERRNPHSREDYWPQGKQQGEHRRAASDEDAGDQQRLPPPPPRPSSPHAADRDRLHGRDDGEQAERRAEGGHGYRHARGRLSDDRRRDDGQRLDHNDDRRQDRYTGRGGGYDRRDRDDYPRGPGRGGRGGGWEGGLRGRGRARGYDDRPPARHDNRDDSGYGRGGSEGRRYDDRDRQYDGRDRQYNDRRPGPPGSGSRDGPVGGRDERGPAGREQDRRGPTSGRPDERRGAGQGSRKRSRSSSRGRRDSRSRSRSQSRERRRERRTTGFGDTAAPAAAAAGSSGGAAAPTGMPPGMLPGGALPQPIMDPAEVVRRMMMMGAAGVGVAQPAGVVTTSGVSTAGLTVAQKRALLWGSKKAEATAVKATAAAPPAAAAPPTEVAAAAGEAQATGGSSSAPPVPGSHVAAAMFGTNRWDAAQFSTEAEKEKFLKIMGVKKTVDVKLADAGAPAGGASVEQPLAGHYAMTRDVQERVLSDMEAAYARGLQQTGKTSGLGAS